MRHTEVTVWRACGGDNGEDFSSESRRGMDAVRVASFAEFKAVERGNSTQLLAERTLSARDGEAEIEGQQLLSFFFLSFLPGHCICTTVDLDVTGSRLLHIYFEGYPRSACPRLPHGYYCITTAVAPDKVSPGHCPRGEKILFHTHSSC